ncbi:hypothetical protein AKJ52_00500 [candidate division MSBL1 archaeon SCGC-AAA382C18]|uniref:Uncharacterized protein n=1 Tax=candidate division MSBL1 archaeon SCGC-AAA382C18 TaxID=1698281 RepID=A0A133VLK0_9EURY|nr:hypothetical protein AKJ52_00500 [candidate division MSBL1 archaeon SCGC-AAA382C18]
MLISSRLLFSFIPGMKAVYSVPTVGTNETDNFKKKGFPYLCLTRTIFSYEIRELSSSSCEFIPHVLHNLPSFILLYFPGKEKQFSKEK